MKNELYIALMAIIAILGGATPFLRLLYISLSKSMEEKREDRNRKLELEKNVSDSNSKSIEIIGIVEPLEKRMSDILLMIDELKRKNDIMEKDITGLSRKQSDGIKELHIIIERKMSELLKILMDWQVEQLRPR